MYYIYVTGHYLGKGISMLLAISRLGTCYTTYSYMLLDSYQLCDLCIHDLYILPHIHSQAQLILPHSTTE